MSKLNVSHFHREKTKKIRILHRRLNWTQKRNVDVRYMEENLPRLQLVESGDDEVTDNSVEGTFSPGFHLDVMKPGGEQVGGGSRRSDTETKTDSSREEKFERLTAMR